MNRHEEDLNRYEMNSFTMCLIVAAGSADKLRPTDFERYLEECHSSGLDLDKAKKFIEEKENLNPYTRERMNDIFNQFKESLEEENLEEFKQWLELE